MNTATLVVAGEPPGDEVLGDLPQTAWVVAVDAGLVHAKTLGLTPDVVIGDFDSVSPSALADVDDERLIRHPVDKDATDLELAMDLVLARPGLDRVVVVGGAGGRLDHFLGNANVLCSNRYADLDIDWVSSAGRACVVRTYVEIHGNPGQTVSLIPMGGDALGVTTVGLRWRLDGENLRFGSSRGISNVLGAPAATVSLLGGVLLVIQPDFA